jgi:hypothetical protein
MPLLMIHRHVPYRIKREYPDAVVKEMARLFRVSETAMRIQLRNYSSQPAEIPGP